jgi:hypothetical protein
MSDTQDTEKQKGYIVHEEQLEALKQAHRKVELGRKTGKCYIPLTSDEFYAFTDAIAIEYPKVEHKYPPEQEILQRTRKTTERVCRYFEEFSDRDGYETLTFVLALAVDMIDCISEGIPLEEKFSLKKLDKVRKQTQPFNQEE